MLIIFSSCSNRNNINTIEMCNKTINITEKHHSINACYVKKEKLNSDFFAFYSRVFRSSVRFDKKEFLKLGIEIKELKKVNYKKEIAGYSGSEPFYYSKYVTEKDDIVFIIFNKDLDPLKMIDYYDTLLNSNDKKDLYYKEMKESIAEFKQVIEKIDL